jgi:hypothetical protein
MGVFNPNILIHLLSIGRLCEQCLRSVAVSQNEQYQLKRTEEAAEELGRE